MSCGYREIAFIDEAIQALRNFSCSMISLAEELSKLITITRDPLPLPKSWRWYDIFRTDKAPARLHPHTGVIGLPHRVQERYSRAEHARRKRRAYVQRLRAEFTGGGR